MSPWFCHPGAHEMQPVLSSNDPWTYAGQGCVSIVHSWRGLTHSCTRPSPLSVTFLRTAEPT